MNNFLKKNKFWILIVFILIIGSYFVINKEGMSLERLCYNRESDGAKICIKGDSSCTYFPDGTSKCTQGKRDCSEFTNCSDCTDKNNKGGSCYWNPFKSVCGSSLEKGFSPFCKNPYQNNNKMQTPLYVPIITLLPTSTLANAAPINQFSI
jgi:hypothetical protein